HHAPSPEESGAADRGRRHFPLFTFSPENLTEDSPIDAYNLVPGPDGRQIGQMSLQGDFTIEMAPDETQGPRDLTAVWRPPANGPLPQRPATAAEEEWLNWVPGLQSVNPSIPLPNDALPLAGLNGNQAAASLIFNRGVLTAGRLARAQNGSIAVYEFKLPGNAPVLGSQAIAGALILRLEGLTRPVFIHGHPSGPLGLINLADRVVRASFTNLPDVEVGEQTRLVHFRHLFNFTNLPVITANQIPLPEGRGIPDTSFGTICPGATFTRVP
ncbi:MAG TPA: hypothetical protein VNW71_17940, partial [Thermoanaerobaculia bacterium]|nr:hypothetical protein [Thermoanaerobaculia bacterium]